MMNNAAAQLVAPVLDLTGLLHFEPEHTIAIDFETYYSNSYTLRKLSTEQYVRSEEFECIGVGVNDGEETVWMEEPEFRGWAKTVPWERCATIMHHAHFDGLILAHHYGVIPGHYFDTMSMARALHGIGNISLEKLMPRYGVGFKGHEVNDAKGKHRADFTDAEYAAYGQYCIGDTNGCKDIFWKMIDDGYPELELQLISSTVLLFTDPKFVLNEVFLQKYLVEERKRKKELLERLTDGDVKRLKSVLMSNDKLAQLLTNLGEDPPRKVSPTTGKEIFAFAKNDPGMQELLEHSDDTIRWIAEARIATKSTINETRTERFLNLGKNGRKLPVYIRYCGAHTHRDSGADGTNWQNLERVDEKKPEKGAIRQAVEAPEDSEVIAADSGQIEARVTAWMAGHDVMLDTFRRNDATGGDFYADIGSTMFRRPISKKDTPLERQLSKNFCLGLGYQMGWFKFAGELLKGMLGADPVQFTMADADKFSVDVDDFAVDPASLPDEPSRKQKFQAKNWRRVQSMVTRISFEERIIHCAVAKYFVDLYRDTNEPIPALWQQMNEVLEAMASGEEICFGPTSQEFPYGCIQVVRHALILPNDMVLRYSGLERKVVTDEDDEEVGRVRYSYLGDHKQRRKIYGGMLTENIVQALARVIVFHQALYIQGKYGYRTATRTHDELVYVEPLAVSAHCEKVAKETMKIPPAWAIGLPLNASSGRGKSYGSCK